MAFKEDFQSFIDLLKTSDDSDQIKKMYRHLLKNYHPDIAPEKDKSLYNDYILLINKAYSAGKIKTKETQIESEPVQQNQNTQKTYIFSRIGPDGKTYNYKCRDYFHYLYKVARGEYDRGHDILHFSGINHADKKSLDQNSLEVMQHYYNAIKCYKYILKNCKDEVFVATSTFELKMTQNAVNVLARTISTSDEKALTVL